MIPSPSDTRPASRSAPAARSTVPPALRSTLALVLIASSGGAWATSVCGTPSPALERLGEGYLLLDDGAPSALDELEPLDRLLAEGSGSRRSRALRLSHLLDALRTASLDGLDGERVRCLGTGGARRAVRWRFDLERLERADRLDGRTVLTAFEARHTVVTEDRGDAFGDERLVDDTLVAEVVEVPSADAWRPSADGTALRANRRFRRAGSVSGNCALAVDALPGNPGLGHGGCSYLTEVDTTARAVGSAIELEQVLYVRGRWSERVLWRLGS